ncbi:MAG: hypothetical protein DCF32_02135 [Leptolyngbya sp.]|nr:MAG: hypothetical protein DCF32_02135 [Leptolyngbya sp.]
MPRLYRALTCLGTLVVLGDCALALPPPDEIPEEILRTEVITEARSPLDGAPISATDYAALQEHLRAPNTEPIVNPEIAELIQLLQLRRLLKPVLPFLR